MDKRILAVLIAAMAGTAYAQSSNTPSGYVSNSSGGTVTNSAGTQVRNSAATGSSTAAPVAQVAQTPNYASPRTAPAPAAGATAAATAAGPAPGYLQNSSGAPALNSANHCVHTSTWAPGLAAEPCDAVARASLAVPPVAAAAPAPEPAPEPNVIEKVTLNTDVLFAFNKAELLPGAKEKLDELAQKSKGA